MIQVYLPTHDDICMVYSVDQTMNVEAMQPEEPNELPISAGDFQNA